MVDGYVCLINKLQVVIVYVDVGIQGFGVVVYNVSVGCVFIFVFVGILFIMQEGELCGLWIEFIYWI